MRGISSHQPGWHITSELLRRSLHQPALVFGKPDRHPQPPPAMCNQPGIAVNELEHPLSTKQSATNDFKKIEVARTLTDRRLLQTKSANSRHLIPQKESENQLVGAVTGTR
jgi:hypothetical protein